MLSAGEQPPVLVRNSGANSPFLLLGDHAGRAIPHSLGGLGLSETERLRHIAWDIGIQGLGERLADDLGACFISQRYSRLVIDCNRDPARPDAICEVSDGTAVPGNQGLSPEQRQARIDTIFSPYHAAISAELDRRAAAGLPTVVIALHSFTPTMNGFARPWRYGVLHLGGTYSNAALAELQAAFGEDRVGDNQPYAMDQIDYTVPRHAIGRGLEYLELETRQDLLANVEGQRRIAGEIAPILKAALVKTPAAGNGDRP